MKVLLALSLLLFLNSVFSLGNIFPCPTFGKCPDGYNPQLAGRNVLNSECYCKKIVKETPCDRLVNQCHKAFNEDGGCAGIETICSTKELIDACTFMYESAPKLCDRTSQKLVKEKYAKTQKQCEINKNDCIRLGRSYCPDAAESCDPDTTLQLCKSGDMNPRDICDKAEIQQEKDRAENTKYSCKDVQELCSTNKFTDSCSIIPKFCDVQTAAKWCYKDDTRQIEKISDEDCSRVVKKSQYLMFGQSKQECWKQVPLCEGGNSEACALVANYCVKEVTSALCNAKKITSKRICKYAGSDKTTSPSHPGCDFFGDRCVSDEGGYCSLATRYCDNDTIRSLCSNLKIKDKSICEKAKGGNSDSIAIHIPIIGGTIQLPGGFGLGL